MGSDCPPLRASLSAMSQHCTAPPRPLPSPPYTTTTFSARHDYNRPSEPVRPATVGVRGTCPDAQKSLRRMPFFSSPATEISFATIVFLVARAWTTVPPPPPLLFFFPCPCASRRLVLRGELCFAETCASRRIVQLRCWVPLLQQQRQPASPSPLLLVACALPRLSEVTAIYFFKGLSPFHSDFVWRGHCLHAWQSSATPGASCHQVFHVASLVQVL